MLERHGVQRRRRATRAARAATSGLLIVACACASAAHARDESAPGFDASELAQRLTRVVEARPLARARVSALVVRERDGAVLFERTPERVLTPASNTKLLTAIAALATFGPTHRFETRILASDEIAADGSVSDLLVRGGGDPALNSEDWWKLAGELRRKGLRHVKGDLVLDDSIFDRERWHPGWGKTSSRAYHAPVSGLTANYGAFAVTVRPGAKAGDPVEVVIDPPVAHLHPVVRATTVAKRSRRGLRVDRRAAANGAESVIVEGEVRAGRGEIVLYRSVLDATRYAGSVLRMQLEAVGIQVDGTLRIGSPQPTKSDAANALPVPPVELVVHQGRALSEIVQLFMKFSNNMVAESLVKALGHERSGNAGSWRNGLPAVLAAIEALGVDTQGVVLRDGSGLAYENKISPRTFVQAIRVAQRSFDFGPEFVASLPLANRDGTLEKRAEGAIDQVRAKTGLLTKVTGLSGVARLSSGDSCAFSILVNGYKGSDEEAMNALDHFVATLVAKPENPLARR